MRKFAVQSCTPKRRPFSAFARALFALIAFQIFFASSALAQVPLPNSDEDWFAALPDDGFLTVHTQIRVVDGKLSFVFSDEVENAWGEPDDEVGRRKKAALGNLLIARKFYIEDRLYDRYLFPVLKSVLGLPVDSRATFPAELERALSKSFPAAAFNRSDVKKKTFYELWVDPLRRPELVSPPQNAPLPEFWKLVMERSLEIVRNGAQMEIIREQVEPSQISDLQTGLASVMIEADDGMQFNVFRLLFTDLNYMDRFQGNKDILRALNRILPHPTSQGLVANVIAAYGISSLYEQGLWNHGITEYELRQYFEAPKASLFPMDLVDSNLFNRNGLVAQSFSTAIDRASQINLDALLYMCSLNERGILEALWGRFSDDAYETEGSPEEMLRKFEFLLDHFNWKTSPDLMERLRGRYPLGSMESVELIASMKEAYEHRKEYDQNNGMGARLSSFPWITTALFGLSVINMSRFATLILAATTSMYMVRSHVPGWRLAQDRTNVIKSMFLNARADWYYEITPESMRDTVIIERKRLEGLRHTIFLVGGFAAAFGVFNIPKIAGIVSRMKGVVSPTHAAMHVDDAEELQFQIQALMRAIEKKFPDVHKAIVEGSHAKYWEKVARFLPDNALRKRLPRLYERVEKLGFRADMTGDEWIAAIQNYNARLLAQKLSAGERLSLAKIAEKAGLLPDAVRNQKGVLKKEIERLLANAGQPRRNLAELRQAYGRAGDHPDDWAELARYLPDESFETVFPTLYQDLTGFGFRAGQSMDEWTAAANRFNASVDEQLLSRSSTSLWEVANKAGLVRPTTLDRYYDEIEREARRIIQSIDEEDEIYQGVAAQVRARSLLSELERVKKVSKGRVKAAEKNHEPFVVIRREEKPLDHIKNMRRSLDEMDDRLQARVGYDDEKHPFVEGIIRAQRRSRNIKLIGPSLGWFYDKVLGWRSVSGTVPIDVAIPNIEAKGAKKVWRTMVQMMQGAKSPKDAGPPTNDNLLYKAFSGIPRRYTSRFDEKARDIANNWWILKRNNIRLSSNTYTKWEHQGLIFGTQYAFIGDRAGEGFMAAHDAWQEEEDFAAKLIAAARAFGPAAANLSWNEGDWNGTLINLAFNLVHTGYSIPIATMAARFWPGRTEPMLMMSIFSQPVISFVIEGAKLTAAGRPGYLFSKECFQAIIQRMHAAPLYHGVASAGANRANWLYQNVLYRTAGRSLSSAGRVAVFTTADKVGRGWTVWTMTMSALHAKGQCKDVDPYEIPEIFVSVPDQAYGFAQARARELKEHYAATMPWELDESKLDEILRDMSPAEEGAGDG